MVVLGRGGAVVAAGCLWLACALSRVCWGCWGVVGARAWVQSMWSKMLRCFGPGVAKALVPDRERAFDLR